MRVIGIILDIFLIKTKAMLFLDLSFRLKENVTGFSSFYRSAITKDVSDTFHKILLEKFILLLVK